MISTEDTVNTKDDGRFAVKDFDWLEPFEPHRYRWWRGGWLQTASIKAVNPDLNVEARDGSVACDVPAETTAGRRPSVSGLAEIRRSRGFYRAAGKTLAGTQFGAVPESHTGFDGGRGMTETLASNLRSFVPPYPLQESADYRTIRKHQLRTTMKTKRISDEMEQALNNQMTREAYQAQVYLSYASWAEVQGFIGITDFLYKHMDEERQHMFKFVKFINDRGGSTKIEAIKAPPGTPKNIGDCLQKTLQHEIDNSKAIDDIVNLALEEKDWATFSFAQWFVKEQIEEETLVNDLIDKYELASQHGDNGALYELDRDMASASQEATLPREEEF